MDRRRPRSYTHFDPDHRPHRMRAVIRWGIVDRLRGERRPSQPGPGAPRVEPDLELIHETPESPRLTWIGHASFLGGLAGARFLVDPVLSERVGWLYRRHVAPGLAPEELPAVDALLVSHNHYDHLDLEAVRHLPRSTPVFVPEGLGRWFVRRGFTAVTELRWWQSAECGPLRITLVPARHWSRRGLFDTNRSLWGGFVVEGGGAALYHAGDTGDFPGFREIRERFPSLTAAMLPIGAYRPGWFMEPNHLNPEQAARAFLELGAHHLVPMHWGTFQLTDEPLREPAARLRAWWREHRPEGRELHLMAVGETVVFEAEMMEHVARRFGGAAPGERVTVL